MERAFLIRSKARGEVGKGYHALGGIDVKD